MSTLQVSHSSESGSHHFELQIAHMLNALDEMATAKFNTQQGYDILRKLLREMLFASHRITSHLLRYDLTYEEGLQWRETIRDKIRAIERDIASRAREMSLDPGANYAYVVLDGDDFDFLFGRMGEFE